MPDTPNLSGGSGAPWLFGTGLYTGFASVFDAEDVIAGLSLPLLKSLMGESPTWRDFIMGFTNQIGSRNLLRYSGVVGNATTLHSLKSLVAGALLPLEQKLWQSKNMRSEGFFRNMSKGTVASLVAGAIGPTLGDMAPAYL